MSQNQNNLKNNLTQSYIPDFSPKIQEILISVKKMFSTSGSKKSELCFGRRIKWHSILTVYLDPFVVVSKGSTCHCNAVGVGRTDVLLDTGDGS